MAERLFRECSFDRATIDGKKRTISVSFSSEQPVDRGSHLEILDHSPQNADFSFLNDSAPVLDQHDTTKQVGVVKGASIVGKKGVADLLFSQGARGSEILQDFQDGIRKNISVGYICTDEVSRVTNADGRVEIRYAWKPLEISPVSIPADSTVGYGRSSVHNHMTPPTVTQPDVRQAEIESIATFAIRTFPRAKRKIETDMAEAVLGGVTAEEFRKAIFAKITDFKSGDVEEEIIDGVQGRGLDVGHQVASSSVFKKFQQGKGTKRDMSVEVNLSRSGNWVTRTTGDPATTTGLTSIDKQPGIVLLGQQLPRIADLMTNTPASGTTIRYISENSLTNAADFTAENGAYPEATWDLVEIDAPIRKITALGRVTDEFFQDYDATRDYINTRLQYMVSIKEDNALLNGNATGQQIRGLLQFANIQTQPQSTDTALNAVFKAITNVRTIGFFEPDAVVMHPNDLQNFRLMTDKNGQYFFGGPFTGSYGQPGMPGSMLFLWGLPVVWTTSIAQGTCLVGAFRMGAQVFRKLGLTIETTNSDGTDFANGRIAVRATTRLALACYRPLAFCTVTGLN